ncbi:hypothetical protein G6F24_014677 [Rhizopus arrhizus]|nr:hypothetical protein G6F24_014677 [Rhizopus arrhizus]
MLWPNRASAASCASMAAVLASPAAWRILASSASGRMAASGLRVKSETGATYVLTVTWVCPRRSAPSESGATEATGSHRMAASACCQSRRTGPAEAPAGAKRIWLTTVPPFCARPVRSSTAADRPSRCAAIDTMAPMVMTPVPPMPATSRR